jgi:hypothetical protein
MENWELFGPTQLRANCFELVALYFKFAPSILLYVDVNVAKGWIILFNDYIPPT